ncbi:hypothetical protein ABZS66_60400 [Dactylosporangium sp. NPDC005572]|uniref:hypothetical protein n=1 Tax=Dactylosporangium sp. NPDC005572 TaxID=3156889 RepID=UPI0033B9B014
MSTVPLALRSVEVVSLAEREPFTADELDYFTDLLGSFSLPVPARLATARRASFRELLGELAPRLAGPVDLAVLAAAVPDGEPGWPTSYLASVAEVGHAFGICDQGATGPFTALRIIAHSLRASPVARAALLVADQRTVHHDEPVPERLRATRNVAVAVLFDAAPAGAPVTVHGPEPLAPPAATARLRALAEGAGPVTLILGRGLAPAAADAVRGDGAVTVLPAPAGLPATGVWSVLAGVLGSGGRTVVADYDPDAGRFAAVTVGGAPPG